MGIDLNEYMAKPDKTIRQHTNDLLEQLETLYKMGYIKDKKIYKLAKDACEYHDYGKINRYFQNRVKSEKKIKFNPKIEVGHNILSTRFLDEGSYDELEDFFAVYNAVLNHHYHTNNIRVLEEGESLIDDNLAGIEDELFEIYEDLEEVEDYINEESERCILVKGLLHRCDYSASAKGDLEVEYKNDFLDVAMDNLLNKWKSENIDKKIEWNELQNYCKKNTDKNLVVVAQTGMGKTEAGLHWIGNNKGFFVLPLKTAINAIYERVAVDILGRNNIEKRIALLHSDNLINYIKDNNKEKEENREELKVEEYYAQTKLYSQPLSITTPDQIFDFVFKYPTYEMKATILSYSKIVIDEIQMYSPDLLAYLLYGLYRINKLGGKFCILTATLAPFIRDFLKKELKLEFEEETFVDDTRRHYLKVIVDEIDVDLIYSNYLKKGGKVLIVCNTIKKAQQIYSELKERLTKGGKDENIDLLHSKYIKKHRAEKEDRILKFGKTEHKTDGIWVATQVVEASLDIDFDSLYTELSDINGLFQRLGRCNRKGIKDLSEVNCYVFTEINKRLLRDGNRDSGFIYKEIYDLSRDGLLEEFKIPKIISEQEKIDMINRIFTTENLRGKTFYSDLNYFFDKIKDLYPGDKNKSDVIKEFRNITSIDIIPQNIYNDKKEEIEFLLEEMKNNDKYLKRIEAREKIKEYSISLAPYEIEAEFGSKENIKLSPYKSLEISNVKYDYDYGFKVWSREEKENMRKVEDSNSF